MILNKLLKDHKAKGYIKSEMEGLQNDQPVYMGYDDENNDLRSGEIEGMILLDRSVDLVTPFCTQGTYEGFLDEKYNIVAQTIRVD